MALNPDHPLVRQWLIPDQPFHECGWHHSPAAARCPTPLEMLWLAGIEYERERAAALAAGMTDDDFNAGWERRIDAELRQATGHTHT